MIQVSTRLMSVILVASLALAGCASEAVKKGDSTDGGVAERRAVERWGFLINGQAEKAYDYLSPGYRATKNREEYAKEMGNRPIRWSKVTPSSKTCSKPEVCVLGLQVDYSARLPGVGKTVESIGFVQETWVKVKGKWWLLPDAPRTNDAK